MGERPFIHYSNSVWVTTMAFCQLFEGLKVRNFEGSRYDPQSTTRWIPVDVVLDTKEKIYETLRFGGIKKMEQSDTRLPRIGIQIQSLNMALDRYTGKNIPRMLEKTTSSDNGSMTVQEVKRDFQPIPFDITYLVTTWCASMEHWTQLTEQILPWFDPYTTVGVKERSIGVERTIKVGLESVSPNFSFNMQGATDRRIIRGEMTFKCETVIYKPISMDPRSTITQVYIDIIDVSSIFGTQTIYLSGGPSRSSGL